MAAPSRATSRHPLGRSSDHENSALVFAFGCGRTGPNRAWYGRCGQMLERRPGSEMKDTWETRLQRALVVRGRPRAKSFVENIRWADDPSCRWVLEKSGKRDRIVETRVCDASGVTFHLNMSLIPWRKHNNTMTDQALVVFCISTFSDMAWFCVVLLHHIVA